MSKEVRPKSPPLELLQERVGYRFNDPSLLIQALTHPSVSSDQVAPQKHNQRLEYLGDAALQLGLSCLLYHSHPLADEGQLTKMRATLVSTKGLAQVAQQLSLGDYLTLGRGEDFSGGRNRPSNLADALEALIGAIYIDGGIDALRKLITCLFQSAVDSAQTNHTDAASNPKGHLQELIQSKSSILPTYHIVEEAGPPHARHFRATVCWGEIHLGSGEGSTKKVAETLAATAALSHPTVLELTRGNNP
jgi:ribonuclease III